jgi:hypothetical protein
MTNQQRNAKSREVTSSRLRAARALVETANGTPVSEKEQARIERDISRTEILTCIGLRLASPVDAGQEHYEMILKAVQEYLLAEQAAGL